MFDSCICIEPDEVVSLLSRRRRVARKEHTCIECRHPIQPGDVYEVDTTADEGEITTYKTCLPCLRVRESMFECGWYYGGIWDDIHEIYCDDEFCLCPPRPVKAAS